MYDSFSKSLEEYIIPELLGVVGALVGLLQQKTQEKHFSKHLAGNMMLVQPKNARKKQSMGLCYIKQNFGWMHCLVPGDATLDDSATCSAVRPLSPPDLLLQLPRHFCNQKRRKSAGRPPGCRKCRMCFLPSLLAMY